MNVRNHLLLNAARYVAFNFARVLVKFHYDAISNAGAALQNYTIQTRFRRACHMRHLDHRERIFAKPRKEEATRIHDLWKRMCIRVSSFSHMTGRARQKVEIYQPAERKEKNEKN